MACALASVVCVACGDAGRERAGDTRDRGDGDRPDWSAAEDEAPPEAAAGLDASGVQKVDGAWLFAVDASAAQALDKDAAREVAAAIDLARRGDDIAFAIRDPELLRVKSTLEQILLHGDAVPQRLKARIARYLLEFYVHHGSAPEFGRGARTNAAGLLRTGFIPGELASAIEIAAADGAVFDVPKSRDLLGANRLQEIEALVAAIRPFVFGRAGAAGGGDPVSDAGAAEESEGIGRGGADGVRVNGAAMALLESLRREGAERGFVSRTAKSTELKLLAARPGDYCLIAFEPERGGGAFRGLVGVADAGAQKPIDAAYARAQALDKIVRAEGGIKSVTESAAPRVKVRAVDALYASGSLGPLFEEGSLWRAVDGPSVRVDEELWLIVNAASAFDGAFGRALVEGLEIAPDAAERRLASRAKNRVALVTLREIAGRGTDGTETRSEKWLSTHLGSQASLLAAMRADLSALRLAFEPAVWETGLVQGEDGARALLEDYVGWTFESYGFGPPPEELAAEVDARRAVLRFLAQKGAVSVKGADGGTPLAFAVADLAVARSAISALLTEVRRIRFVGDARAAQALFESSRAMEARWQRELETRFRRLERPRSIGFAFPRLLAVEGEGGDAARLNIGSEKDHLSARIGMLPRPLQ